MSTYSTDTPRSAAALSGVEERIARLAAAYRRWRLERQTLAELSALPDRMLGDLGFQRHELPGIARDAAQGHSTRD